MIIFKVAKRIVYYIPLTVDIKKSVSVGYLIIDHSVKYYAIPSNNSSVTEKHVVEDDILFTKPSGGKRVKGHMSIQRIKVMHVCVKIMSKGSKEALTVLIVIQVTQVERVKNVVCSFYATLHTEYCTDTQFFTHVERFESVKYYVLYSVYRAPCSSRREGYLKSLLSFGFSGLPPVSLRRQLC